MRYPIFRSIRTNLILLVLVSVLPALGAIIYSGVDNNRRAIKEAENNTLRVLADLAYDYELTVQQTRLFLSMLARLPDIQNQNAAACNKILGELIKQNSLYVKLFAATADGTVYASNKPFSSHTINHQKYYQDIIKTRAFSVGEYEAGVTVQRPVIHFAYPVIDTKQRLRGVVALALDLNRYGEIIIKKELPEDSAFAIYDHNHIYLYRYPDPGKYIGKKDRPDMIKRMLTGPDEEAITAIGVEGIPRLGAYRKLYLQGSSIPYHFMRIGISAEKALANARNTFLINIVLLCSALFAALILALVFGDIFIARRLNRLVIASNRLESGDLAARTGLRHDEGEMGRLAHAFDEMADALERKEAQRKRAEEELRIFMESVENSSDAVGMSTPEGKHYYQNRAFDELFGPVGENPPESVYVDPAVGHEVFRAIMEGGQWTGEAQMYAKDRRILDILLRAYANKDKSGSITALVGIHMDITKRKRAEESLKQSEERMRLFFERQLVGMAITSLEKGWLQVNKRLSEMLGYLPEELSLRTWAELTYPDDLAADVAQFNRLLSGEIDHYALEKRFIRKDGAVISTNLSVGCVRRHNGSVDYVLALLEDITEQKRIEADLRDIEARYSLIMNNITDRIWLTDMNFKILWASESVANDRGYQLEEMNPFPFEKLLTPDSLETAIRAISEELTPQRLQQTELDISKTLELEFFRKDGSTFWSEVTTKVLRDHDGTPNSILGVGRDITERKRVEEELWESEKRYRSIFETTLEGIYQTSPQGRYLRVNPAFALMLGFDSPEDLIESITDIGTQVYVNPDRRFEFKKHLSEQDRVENFEAQLCRKDGTTMWGLINGVTVRNENGEILYYTGGMMDITARKEAETRLRHTYEQLRAANEQMRAQYVSLMESERSLRESEEKYRRLTETAHDVIVSVDLNWKITYVNQATLNMAGGMNPVGMSLLNFTPPHMHELQEAMMQKRREGFRDVLSFEWEINPPTGKKAIFEIRSTLLTEDEKPSGVLFVARDITERKEAETRLRYAEEKYRLIAENMVDVIAVLDMKLGYTYISPSIMRLRGLTVEEAMKETLDQVMTPASLKLAFAAFEEEMKMEVSGTADPDRTRIFELEEFRKDGSKIWVETNSSFLRDKDGKPVGMI